jgi:hypothetical protein
MVNSWPLQSESEMNEFYGNPRGRNGLASQAWERQNLVYAKAPYVMTYAGKPVTGARVHKKCKEAFEAVFELIWDASGRDQHIVNDWGASIYAGAYNYRLMRGGNRLSIHSWGAAIDLDPARNAFHDTTPNFRAGGVVVKAFESLGATWGGRWSGRSCDGMHFQFARVH